jgi:hypothetical protein
LLKHRRILADMVVRQYQPVSAGAIVVGIIGASSEAGCLES